jgi:hypothetical protein
MQSRLETLSPKQLLLCLLGFLCGVAIILVASFKTEPMLIYNTGDSFACAHSFDLAVGGIQTFGS